MGPPPNGRGPIAGCTTGCGGRGATTGKGVTPNKIEESFLKIHITLQLFLFIHWNTKNMVTKIIN